jgi:hypothetical protein
MSIHNGRWWTARNGLAAASGLAVVLALLAILPGSGTVPLAQQCTGTLTTQGGAAVTVTRASNKYCTKSDGTMVLLSANQPAVEANGLLVESGATNLLLQSQALATTPWGTLNGTSAAPTVTNNTVDLTDPLGGNTATKIVYPSVSAGGAFSLVTQTLVGASAGTYEQAIYLRGASSGTTYLEVSDGTTIYSVACAFTSTAWTRCSRITTSASSFTRFDVGVNLNDGAQSAQPAQTVYAWQGDFAVSTVVRSPIATAATTVAQAADVVSASDPLASGATAWSMAATATSVAVSPNIFLLSLGTNGLANSVVCTYGGNTPSVTVRDGSNNSLQVTTASSGTPQTATRIACADTAGVLKVLLNSVDVSSAPVGTGTGLATMNATLQIGGLNGGGPLSGGAGNVWLRDICVDPSPTKCR